MRILEKFLRPATRAIFADLHTPKGVMRFACGFSVELLEAFAANVEVVFIGEMHPGLFLAKAVYTPDHGCDTYPSSEGYLHL